MSAPPHWPDHPSVEAMTRRLADEPWRVTLAWREDELVGLLAVQAQDGWLRQLFVRPDQQRTGVGAQLLEAARREMPDGFFLHSHPQNLPARRFYEAQGLTCAGDDPYPESGPPRVRYLWRRG